MLSSITPLGERGRRQRWGITMISFALAATAGGALIGASAGGLGQLALGGVPLGARWAGLSAGLALALALEFAPGRLPGPRRQVDERWLTRYRGWVYGGGYGLQLGLGISTVISSAATYAALLAALLSCGAGTGAVVMGSYGAVRGLTPLLAARVQDPVRLLTLHRRLAGRRRAAAIATRLALAGLLLASLAVPA